MSAISMMELNAKSPFIWDWDNLVVLPSRTVDVSKKVQVVDSEFDAIDGFELGSFNSSGGKSDGGSGGSASELAFGSSSKSSKSASVDSSMNREMREPKFTLETSDCYSQNPSNNRKELASTWPNTAPSVTEFSIDSGESLIGLKLGKRTYFENASGGNNAKTSAAVPASSYTTAKRSKLSSQSTETPRCQVEGCNLDLSSAKDYHRKHRVCESHSKSPKVMICGVERRFCQQCSRFHSLSEFDQKKRSCRRRLSDHNSRRRKPKPEIIQFNSMRLPSSLHEGRNQVSLAFNQVPMVQTRPSSNATWDFTGNSKFTQEKLSLFPPPKTGDALNITRNEPQEAGFKLSYCSTQLMPSKSATSEVFHQGFQLPTTTTNMDAAQDLRALSLLSTNSWVSCSQEPASALDHSAMLHHHHHHTRPVDLPLVSAEYWQGEQQSVSPGLEAPTVQKSSSSNNFQEFQLFKAPNEPSFYSYEDLR